MTALATAPVCSADQDAEWSHVQQVTLGAAARDPVGHAIGRRPARKFLFINNWYPLDVVKQTVCGTLFRYSFYDGLGREADWNNFVIPFGSYAALFASARAYANPGAVKTCAQPEDCFEAEVTPQEKFLRNSYFPPEKNGASNRVGQPICLYGPWVAEKLHGDRPEIHPSEIVWWREESDAGPHHFFLLVQDASRRFDDEGDYGRTDQPGGRPWAESPRSGELRVAFESLTSQPERALFVYLVGGNVATVPATDPAFRLDNLLEYQGRPVLRLTERQPAGGDGLAVDFDVCRDAANTRLRGYAKVALKVGAAENEGFAVVRVGPEDEALPQFRVAPPRVEARLPRRDDSTGVARLVVDLEPRFAPDARRAPGDAVVVDAEISGVRRRVPTPAAGRPPVVPAVAMEPGKDVPVAFGFPSGRREPVTLPGLGVAAAVTAEKPQLGAADPSAWPSMPGAAAARSPAARGAPPAGLTVRTARSWSIDAQIEYAPVRNGEVAAEDDSSISDELNGELRRGGARRLAGNESLFRLGDRSDYERSFTATDRTTGRPVPVVVNRPAVPGQIAVRLETDGVRGLTLRVVFPEAPASHLYRLVAAAAVRDVFGHEGTLREEVWSHVLTAENRERLVEALVEAAAGMAGASPERTREASRIDLTRVAAFAEREPRQQRARLLRLAAERAAEDDYATPGELDQLVRVAALSRDR